MPKTRIIQRVIRDADLLLEVLDARLIEQTRNTELEQTILSRGKKLLFVINKSDLVDKAILQNKTKELFPSIFISSRDRLGTTKLREKILSMSKGKPVTVGVIGMPNVGKSSVINALAGRKKASTSIVSGHTRGVQIVKADNKLRLLDTPGEFLSGEGEEYALALVGSKDFNKVKDPEHVVLRLFEEYGEAIAEHYHVTFSEDADELLKSLTVKFKLLKKGGVPDLRRMAVRVLQDWQRGLIR